jgi:SAM-dependent methyltransferase
MSSQQTIASRIKNAIHRGWNSLLRLSGARGGWPPVGWIAWGSFQRLEPVNRTFGFQRGQPIDRHFIETFLQAHAEDIRGNVLEVGDRGYTLCYGGKRVVCSDVLHAVPGNPLATIVGRLDTGEGIPTEAFDCVILTQTMHVIFDIRAAVKNLRKMLKPGGVALVSIPCISQVSAYDADQWGDYWRMTPAAVKKLFAEAFPDDAIEIAEHGNVMVAIAFLQGLVIDDLSRQALETYDPQYPLLTCVRATRTK